MALHTFPIPPEAAGIRAGEYLRRLLPSLPESALRKLFDARDVKMGSRRISRDLPLEAGQALRIYLPDALEGHLPADSGEPRRPERAAGASAIVYEDADVLLVNKPAGIQVLSDDPAEVTLTTLYRDRVKEDAFPFLRPCHRLDAKTSGLCLFAKRPEAEEILVECFRDRTVQKDYICLVRGQPKPPAALCEAYLRKDAAAGRVTILDHPAPGAKPIRTAWETLEAGPVSRLLVHLLTGRTHQIRAHLAALGHPLLGDDLYGDRTFNREQKARTLKLCAVSLTLDTGGRLPALDHRTFRIDPPF